MFISHDAKMVWKHQDLQSLACSIENLEDFHIITLMQTSAVECLVKK